MPTSHFLVLFLIAALFLSPDSALAQAPAEPSGKAIGEAVEIVNGAELLSGSLLVPDGEGPHPAFVAIEGSGGASFRNSWMDGYFPFWKDIAEFLVSHGYAVLLFDKPGVHESTGNWRRQSFDDRAKESMAAVRHLAIRDDIDSTRIGLIGHSQGGWIAQIAGAHHPDEVAFLVLLAGPSVSVKQQIRDDTVGAWTCRGLSGINLTAHRTGLDLWLGALSLVAHVTKPGYLPRIIHFDPRGVLPEIRQPTLAIFAEHDYLVVPETNQARLNRYFGSAQHDARLAIQSVAGADHFFRASTRCADGQKPSKWAPGFFEALGDTEYWTWIRALDTEPF